ncbi:MAG: zinc-ribbon domain-containing protein [Acidobacteriaceae bacterium]
MGFCQSCGTAVADEAVACTSCGSPRNAAPPGTIVSGTASSGLTSNTAGALTYILGLITGILFLVIDPHKSDRFVRFHAFQSIFFNVAWIGLWIVWTIIGLILGAVTHGIFFLIQLPVNLALIVGGFCLWAFLMFSAYQGKTFKLPIIGNLAAKQAGMSN